MPTYTYRCTDCDTQFERFLSLADFEKAQLCPACGTSPAQKIIVAPVGFVLKGDGWTGKNIRIKGQMASRRKRLGTKEHEQKMEAPGVHLVPNVGGERVDSWQEAQKLARSMGKDASSYDTAVRTERREGKA